MYNIKNLMTTYRKLRICGIDESQRASVSRQLRADCDVIRTLQVDSTWPVQPRLLDVRQHRRLQFVYRLGDERRRS